MASLIQNDQHNDVLTMLKAYPDKLFESAYCYLQLGDFTKALEAITKMPSKDTRALYLQAQIVRRN